MAKVRIIGKATAPILFDLVLEGRLDFTLVMYALGRAEVDASVPFLHRWAVQEALPRLTDPSYDCGLRLPSPRQFRHLWGLRKLLDSNLSDEDFQWLRDKPSDWFWLLNELWPYYKTDEFDLHLGFRVFGGIDVPEPSLRDRLRHLVGWLTCMVTGTYWYPDRNPRRLFPPTDDTDALEREARHVVIEEMERAASKLSWWASTFGGQGPAIPPRSRARFEEVRDRILEKLLVLEGGISLIGDE